MHPEDGVLQALLDGELDPTAASEARQLIESCLECRARFDALGRDDALLRQVLPALDRPLTRIPVTQIIARARRDRGEGGLRHFMRWAAVITLIVIGAGALYAVPGSPLRHWVDQLLGKQAPIREPGVASGATTGIAMPFGAHFQIVVVSPKGGGTRSGSLTINLTDDSSVAVRRVDGLAHFVAEIDGMRVEATDMPADFAIGIPRLAPWVEVIADERRVFLKDGSRIITDTRPDSLGRYVLNFTHR